MKLKVVKQSREGVRELGVVEVSDNGELADLQKAGRSLGK